MPAKVKSLQLSQFAFRGMATASSSRAPSEEHEVPNTSNTVHPAPPPKKPGRPRKVVHEFMSEFTDKQISTVLKCVSCNARWTVRKTATEKRRHMQVCSRKAAYTPETMRLLLQKEINDRLPSTAPPRDVPPPESPTLFEGYKPLELPKRRSKSVKTTASLVIATSNRDEILERAQRLIQSETSLTVGPRFTQIFAPSRLGAASGTRPLDIEASPSPPPTTQDFAPSRLGATSGTRLFQPESSPLPATQGFAPTRFATATGTSLFSGAGEEVSSPRSRSRSKSPSEGGLSETRKTPRKTATPLARRSPSRASSKGSDVECTPRAKRRSAKTPAIWNKDWQKALMKKISEDREIKLKILRYEPISLHVFHTLLIPGRTKLSLKHKTMLVAFLENEGITTYDPETTWGKTKASRAKSVRGG
ncbi:hypothetical protein CC2G_010411 [Coprinopsis cinerea AmutBmut pab1-1]|nr:hypothetical protein CC2G_010411 [Coprinopsis cinerea AmutBmut pab1-1]